MGGLLHLEVHPQHIPWHLTLLAQYGYMGMSSIPMHSPMEPTLVDMVITALLQLLPFATFSKRGRNS